LQWLQTCFPNVLDVCCKCFNYFWTYVINISSRCCKNRSWCCTCCSGTHLQQPPATDAAREGHHGVGMGHESCEGHSAGTGHKAAWATMRAQTRSGAGSHVKQAQRASGHSGARRSNLKKKSLLRKKVRRKNLNWQVHEAGLGFFVCHLPYPPKAMYQPLPHISLFTNNALLQNTDTRKVTDPWIVPADMNSNNLFAAVLPITQQCIPLNNSTYSLTINTL
jgi:hypothetical protein